MVKSIAFKIRNLANPKYVGVTKEANICSLNWATPPNISPLAPMLAKILVAIGAGSFAFHIFKHYPCKSSSGTCNMCSCKS